MEFGLSSDLSIVSPLSKTRVGSMRAGHSDPEAGHVKAIAEPSLLRPVQYKQPWRKCWVRKLEKCFLMQNEADDRFMMGAVKVGFDFYISQYPRFTEVFDEDKPLSAQVLEGRYCAVLRRVPGKSTFRLFSLSCENCDDRLGRYTCNSLSEGSAARSPEPTCLVSSSSSLTSTLTSAARAATSLASSASSSSSAPASSSSSSITTAHTTVAARPIPEAEERSMLLELSQSVLFLEQAGVNARRMKVFLPAVNPSDSSRAVWCPRCPRGSFRGHSPFLKDRLLSTIADPAPVMISSPSASHHATDENVDSENSAPSNASTASGKSAKPFGSSSALAAAAQSSAAHLRPFGAASHAGAGASTSAPTTPTPAFADPPSLHRRSISTGGGRSCTEGSDEIELNNRLPKWSDDIGSLTMKFLGSRVAESSSKNFLFEIASSKSAQPRPAIQFGKLSPATFSLDFKHPLSPLQAFGMFLAANAWTGKLPAGC